MEATDPSERPGARAPRKLIVERVEDIEPDPDGTIRWWRPGWRDIWGGASRLTRTGAVLLVALVFIASVIATWRLNWGTVGVVQNLLILASLLLTFVLAGLRPASDRVLAARKQPFCIHCGYGLAGLPDFRQCPECGKPYSFALSEQYRRNPTAFIRRWDRAWRK